MTATTGANIRPAASLLILRDGPGGTEVLLMRRPERGDNDFRSGMCVFPGGVLDRADAQAHGLCFGLDDTTASARLGLPHGGLDYFIAALRESFEEVGLLFVCGPDGGPIDMAAHAGTLRDWRSRLHRGDATIAALCLAMGWRLDLRDMAYFAHWLTPVVRPKRFDTRFFVRVAPAGQQAMPDMGEALELLWLTPDEALDPARGLKLLNVTQKVLHSIRGFASAQAGFRQARDLRGVRRIFPRMALGRSGPRFVIDGDAAYAEVVRLDPDGRGVARCDLAPGDVTQLSPRLWRVCGAHGNAYLVADTRRSAAAIIDANPDDVAQLQALLSLGVAPVRQLLVTRMQDARIEALRAHWPQAQCASAPAPGQVLEIGTDSRLRVGAVGMEHLGYLIEEEGIALGHAPSFEAAGGGGGIEWLAPPQGFLQHLAAG
jgi:8-oxo-dGTP pyrophosphatase MutT (NUDIX family)